MNLLDLDLYDELLIDPMKFEALITSAENVKKRVVVDEIQRLPRLLDLVHKHIQKSKRQFILTGSSSRRLKQMGTNLLAGRAFVYNLYPLSSTELSNNKNLKYLLQWGGA